MLRLFSNIRKSLINEGRTSRYVRYAVGEFLLIVAGILVALQIQNWNEERKQEQERRELIEGLITDFRTNRQKHQMHPNQKDSRGMKSLYSINCLISEIRYPVIGVKSLLYHTCTRYPYVQRACVLGTK